MWPNAGALDGADRRALDQAPALLRSDKVEKRVQSSLLIDRITSHSVLVHQRPGQDLYVLESRRSGLREPHGLWQCARDSTAPQLWVGHDRRGEVADQQHVRRNHAAPRSKYAPGLCEGGVLVGRKIDHSVRDHNVNAGLW